MSDSKNIFSGLTIKSVAQIAKEFNTSPETGLHPSDITRLQKNYGLNEIKGKEVRWFDILLRQFMSPFIYLLLATAIVYFFLESPFDAIVILCVVVLNALLGFVQEYRAYRALKTLENYIVSSVSVRRGGKEVEIVSNQLVPGDIVILYPGDIIPADIRFVQDQDITVDESALTGESNDTIKDGNTLDHQVTEPFQAKNIGFCGTTIVSGKAIGIVFATGANTTLGDISLLTAQTIRLGSFEKNIARFSTFIIRLMIISIIIVFCANIIIRGSNIDILQLILFASALAITVVPEALPIITTFALSQGALRLAHHKAVVKRLSAIEDLGNIEVLCTDKTGTLTENESLVEDVYGADARQVVLQAYLVVTALEKKLEHSKGFDYALYRYLNKNEHASIINYKHLAEVPFDHIRLRNLVLICHDSKCELIVRGAPEGVLQLCSDIDEQRKEQMNKWIQDQGRLGRRVLAVAKKVVAVSQSNEYDLLALERDLQFVGLIAFGDPLKKTSIEAVARARALGITIKILSGDMPEVCGDVAQKIGLIDDASQVITGQEFDALSQIEKAKIVQKMAVFARVSPQQKYEIIVLLQKEKDVAYIGDGINDAPALKVANVALVVQTATAIARDAADIILLNKSLMVVVEGVAEGRKVFANTFKYVRSMLASTFGNFYSLALASMVLDYFPMLPIQLLLLNLMSDLPMIAIATDTIDADELQRPAKYDMRGLVIFSLFLGSIATLFDFVFFGLFYHLAPALLQTSWFIESLLAELVFVFSVRTHGPFFKASMPSWTLLGFSIGMGALGVLLPFTYFGQRVFSFVPLEIHLLSTIGIIIVAYFIATDVVKVLYYRVVNSQKKG